jgi:glycosyl hydrolase family 26
MTLLSCRFSTRVLNRCLATTVAFAAAFALLVPGAVSSVDAEGTPARLEPDHGIYFGVNLDWAHDSPQAFSERLGLAPAVYVNFMRFPLGPDERTRLENFAQQLTRAHAMGLLTLEPAVALDDITPELAQDLAETLAPYNRRGIPLIVRFAHEMNGSWYSWSQQPTAYVRAFRTLAQAIHDTAPLTAMLWAPNYAGGYPFTGGPYAAVAGSQDYADLDTTGDGVVDQWDDPYAPYYPGDDAVDWVGMTIYHWGDHWPWGKNVVPEPDKFVRQLTGSYVGAGGDDRMLPNFNAIYAIGHHKPMAIPETSAFFNTTVTGDSEIEIKRRWWQQVFGAAVLDKLPAIKMINWFEWRKPESEVQGAVVDWTLTSDARAVATFRNDLPLDRFLFASDLILQLPQLSIVAGGSQRAGLNVSAL